MQCTLCPRECRIKEGRRGACFVRVNHGGRLILDTYGYCMGLQVDPIEKKPLNHFLPGTPILSFGTAGCNLTCDFCQNWNMSRCREMSAMMERALPTDIAELAVRHQCPSVAFTYNDPVIYLEYAEDTAAACHAKGVRCVAVTAGYIQSPAREDFFRFIDAANVDLKAFTEDFYRAHCGAKLETVKETLVHIRRETEVWLELTTLLIPGENDSPEEIDAMTKWVVSELGPDVPMHFTAFHPAYRLVDRDSTPPVTLRRAREIAQANGVRYTYVGNVRDDEGATTYCHQCHRALIRRSGYAIIENVLTPEARCPDCGAGCAGTFCV